MKGTTPDRPMRVLHVIARLNVGGPAIYVSLLASRLRPPAYESAVLCGQPGPDEGDMRYYAEQCGVQPIVLPGLGRDLHPVRDVATLVGVYRHIRRWRPDIVVTHTAKAGFVGRIAARLAGVPVIIHTFHGHVFDGYFGPRATGVFLRLERFLARLSTRIVVLSESQRDDLVDRYGIAPRDKFAVLPLGLNLAPFTSSVRKNGRFRHACGIPATAPLIGIVGRLAPIKNHEMFVRAAVRIRAQHPSSRFAVIGDGECRSAIETAVRQLGLMDTFVFTGWLRDLVDVYADLDVCVLTSRNEGTPVSLLEALAAGCPVVATDVGGVADLLRQGDWGRLVPSEDDEALAREVVRLLVEPSGELVAEPVGGASGEPSEEASGDPSGNPSREALEEAATIAGQVAAEFDIGTRAAEMDRLYRTLLGRDPVGITAPGARSR